MRTLMVAFSLSSIFAQFGFAQEVSDPDKMILCINEGAPFEQYVRGYLVNQIHFQRGGSMDYLKAAQSCEGRLRTILNNSAREGLHDPAKMSVYIDGLKSLNRISQNPVTAAALSGLVYRIQKQWDEEFFDLFYQQKSGNRNMQSQIALLGYCLGQVASFNGPEAIRQKVGGHFELFYEALTLSTQTGDSFSNWGNQLAIGTQGNLITPPPARYLTLAMGSSEDSLSKIENRAFKRETAAMGAGNSAFLATVLAGSHFAPRIADRLHAPAWIEVPILLGSAVSGYYLGKSVDEWTLDALQKMSVTQLRQRLVDAVNDLLTSDYANAQAVGWKARKIVDIALALDAERNRPLLQAYQNLAASGLRTTIFNLRKAISSLESESKQNTADYAKLQSTLKSAIAQLDAYYKEIHKVVLAEGRKMDTTPSPLVSRYMVRQTLLKLITQLRSKDQDDSVEVLAAVAEKLFIDPIKSDILAYLKPYLAQNIEKTLKYNNLMTALGKDFEDDEKQIGSEIFDPTHPKRILHLSERNDVMMLQLASVFRKVSKTEAREGEITLADLSDSLFTDRMVKTAVMLKEIRE